MFVSLANCQSEFWGFLVFSLCGELRKRNVVDSFNIPSYSKYVFFSLHSFVVDNQVFKTTDLIGCLDNHRASDFVEKQYD